jgi:hypothetical protein
MVSIVHVYPKVFKSSEVLINSAIPGNQAKLYQQQRDRVDVTSTPSAADRGSRKNERRVTIELVD